MMLMMQNFGSNPKINCNTITDVVMIMGFLYCMILFFIFLNVEIGIVF